MKTIVALLSAVTLLSCSRADHPGVTAASDSPAAAGATKVAIAVAKRERSNAKELGWVAWQRDYDAAIQESKATGKPLFLLFQEVPGCSTCVGFGESVLSHPLLIEAIETEFTPVAIMNNKGGADAEVLRKFDEPSWNNPVVRFVASDGRDLLPRADGVWSTKGIAARMVTALGASGRDVPDYLSWVNAEYAAKRDRATFSMYCYWSGEACLGDIDGVLSTNAGWLDGREVVEVDFDENRISRKQLQRLAEKRSCGEFVTKAGRARDASDSDRKYHLQRSSWKYLPLTPWQASRVNAAVGKRHDPERWLSPRQKKLHQAIVAALAKDSGALSELQRPEELRDLAAYEFALRERLASM